MRNPEELETLVSKADWHTWFRSKHAREVRHPARTLAVPSLPTQLTLATSTSLMSGG